MIVALYDFILNSGIQCTLKRYEFGLYLALFFSNDSRIWRGRLEVVDCSIDWTEAQRRYLLILDNLTIADRHQINDHLKRLHRIRAFI
jgi:hypothetical protein